MINRIEKRRKDSLKEEKILYMVRIRETSLDRGVQEVVIKEVQESIVVKEEVQKVTIEEFKVVVIKRFQSFKRK